MLNFCKAMHKLVNLTRTWAAILMARASTINTKFELAAKNCPYPHPKIGKKAPSARSKLTRVRDQRIFDWTSQGFSSDTSLAQV